MFGYPIETKVPHQRYWGARAIYKYGEIDLLHDRQLASDMPQDAGEAIRRSSQEFFLWINGYALPWLQNHIKEIGLSNNDPQVIVLHQFKYELRACTNGSCGYLYIGCVEHTLVDCEPHLNNATKVMEKVVQAGDLKFVVDDGIVPVGTKGVITTNQIGPATVVGYYNENYGDIKLACLMVEAHKPPEWIYTQHCQNDAEKLVKRGLLPREKGTDRNYPDLNSKAYKAWKKTWTLKPFGMWPNGFKPDAVLV